MKLRIAVSVIAWLLSLPGMFFHFMFATTALDAWSAWPNTGSLTPYADIWIAATLPLSALAWPALAWMNMEWIGDRPAPVALPIVGSVLALAWLVVAIEAAFFLVLVAPCVLLAIYLVAWHLRRRWQADRSVMPTPPGDAA